MALSFAGSRSARLQPAEKKRPSPLHSTSGWESRIFISHLVPDLPSPVTKNTGVPLSEGTGTPASLRAGASFLPTSLRCHALPSRRTTAYSATCDGMSSLAWCAVMWFPREQNSPGHPSSKPPAHPVTVLPVEVLLVTAPDQELPGLLFEDAPVLLREVVLPVPGHTLAIERRRVLLSPLATPGELLEASRTHAVLHHALLCIDPEKRKQPAHLHLRTLQQVFVAHLRVAVSEQSRSVFDGPAHEESPVACRLPQPLRGEYARLRRSPGILAQSLAFGKFLGGEPVEVALAGAAPSAVQGGDRSIPAVPYDVDHPGPGIYGADLPHEPFVQERRLVADEPLAAPGERGGEEVLCGQAHQGDQVLVGVSIPAPHGAFDPQPQVLGVGQGVVERAREGLFVCGVEVSAPPARGEKASLTLAQYLGMGVQDLHQPSCARFAEPRDEEHRGATFGKNRDSCVASHRRLLPADKPPAPRPPEPPYSATCDGMSSLAWCAVMW